MARVNVGIRNLSVALACALVLGAWPARPAGAEPRWRGDFEAGDLSQWSPRLPPRVVMRAA